jgi:thymidylate kinase
MVSVALVGPDGAGKTTIGRRLERTFPVPLKYIYMGDNLDACNFLLPTTRLARALTRARRARLPASGLPDRSRPVGRAGRVAAALRATAVWANHHLAEEWFRQLLAWYFQWRGAIVLFDRHFLADYYAHDVAPGRRRRSLGTRLHGLLLLHVYPRPDLVIFLDAPPAVVLARKGEGTLQTIEARRREYPPLVRLVERFAVVDASQPEDDVAQTVAALIASVHAARSRRAGTSSATAAPGHGPPNG